MKALESLKVYAKETDKTVWGPFFWQVLHNQAKEYKITTRWLNAFIKAIPCHDCREHFIETIKNHPIEVAKNDLLWTWIVHNIVNTERSNRPFFSLNEFKRKYK